MDVISAIKLLPGRRWNNDKRYWYFHQRHFDLAKLIVALELFAEVDYTALQAFDNGIYEEPIERDELLARSKPPSKIIIRRDDLSSIELPKGYLEKLVQKRYSPNTIKTYITYMRSFISEFEDRDLPSINTQEINDYILKLIRTKGISPSQQNPV